MARAKLTKAPSVYCTAWIGDLVCNHVAPAGLILATCIQSDIRHWKVGARPDPSRTIMAGRLDISVAQKRKYSRPGVLIESHTLVRAGNVEGQKWDIELESRHKKRRPRGVPAAFD